MENDGADINGKRRCADAYSRDNIDADCHPIGIVLYPRDVAIEKGIPTLLVFPVRRADSFQLGRWDIRIRIHR